MRVEAEVPERARLVREGRRHGGVVDEEHLFAGVTLVVLVHRVDDRRGHGRTAVALEDVVGARIDRLLQLHQRFLGRNLVVVARQLDLLAVEATLFVQLLEGQLVRSEGRIARRPEGTGKRVDEGHLDLGTRGPRQRHGRDGCRKRGAFDVCHVNPPEFEKPRT